MVHTTQIVAGSIVTGLGQLAGQQPLSAVHIQDAGYQDGISEASLEYMKALNAEVGV